MKNSTRHWSAGPEDDESKAGNDLALRSPRRRMFILLSMIAGLGAIASPFAVPRILRRFGLEPDLYSGPLIGRIDNSLGRLDRGEIGPLDFTGEIHRLLHEIDLEAEFNGWMDDGRNYILYRNHDVSPWRKRSILLFYIPPGTAHAPHSHHEVISIQCAVRGEVRQRQYERVKRLAPDRLALRPVSDGVLEPGESLRTTEFHNNVHWFGAESQPAIVLNYNINGGIEKTFDPKGGREVGRYYLDPTVSDREGDLIAAPELGYEEAIARFAERPLSAFPGTGRSA